MAQKEAALKGTGGVTRFHTLSVGQAQKWLSLWQMVTSTGSAPGLLVLDIQTAEMTASTGKVQAFPDFFSTHIFLGKPNL